MKEISVGFEPKDLTRRGLLFGGAALALNACRPRRATGYPGYALISTSGENSLAIVDLNTFHLARKLDLHGSPTMVAANAHRAYVLTPANGTIHEINPETFRSSVVLRSSGGLDLFRLAPGDGPLVAASAEPAELLIAQAGAKSKPQRIALGDAAKALEVHQNTENGRTYAAVATGTRGTVELADIGSGAHHKRTLGGELTNLVFRSDGQLLFVANARDQSLIVLDVPTLRTVCELPLPMRPENLVFTADQGQLFVSGPGMDAISIVYVYNALEVEQTVLAGRAPGAMACSDVPRYLFVASRAGSEISVLSIETRKLIALTAAGSRPSRIVITPDQQYALVLNADSGDLAVIRIPKIKGNRLRNGASLFAMVPVGSKPTDIAILPQPNA